MADASGIRVFVSYARVDSAFVDRLEADLLARNMTVWVDRRQLAGGQIWMDELERAIDSSEVVVIAVSPDSMRSEWVRREIGYAQQMRKRLIPVIVHAVEKAPLALNDIQWINLEASYDTGLNELLNALATTRASNPDQAPPQEADSAADVNEMTAVRQGQARDIDVNELYREGLRAQSAGDLDRQTILWQQIIDRDPHYGNDSLATQMRDLEGRQRERQIQRLRELATERRQAGETAQLIGTLQALLTLRADDQGARDELVKLLWGRFSALRAQGDWAGAASALENTLQIRPTDARAKEYLPIAQTNEKASWRYANAQSLLDEGDNDLARRELEQLRQDAPYFGDPRSLAAKVGLAALPTYEVVKQQEHDRRAAENKARAEAEAERRRQEEEASAERRRQEQETARKTAEATKAREAKEAHNEAERQAMRSKDAWMRRRETWAEVQLSAGRASVRVALLAFTLGAGAMMYVFTRSIIVALIAVVVAGTIGFLLGYRRALSVVEAAIVTGVAAGLVFTLYMLLTVWIYPLVVTAISSTTKNQSSAFGSVALVVDAAVPFAIWGLIIGGLAGIIPMFFTRSGTWLISALLIPLALVCLPLTGCIAGLAPVGIVVGVGSSRRMSTGGDGTALASVIYGACAGYLLVLIVLLTQVNANFLGQVGQFLGDLILTVIVFVAGGFITLFPINGDKGDMLMALVVVGVAMGLFTFAGVGLVASARIWLTPKGGDYGAPAALAEHIETRSKPM